MLEDENFNKQNKFHKLNIPKSEFILKEKVTLEYRKKR